MKTFRDLFGFGFVPQIVFDTGGDSGGGGGGGGDSRPEKAKALDEPTGTSAADAYKQYADTMIAGGGGTNLSGSNALSYEEMEALAGSDRDPTPVPVPVAQPVVSATSDLNVAPVVDYSDIDFGSLPLLPQQIPVEYKDTTSGIEKVTNFYFPPAFDLTDPNEPLVQDGKPFSGIAYGEVYESGQPVGAVNVDNIAGLGELELPDLSLTPATATADLEVGPSLTLPTVSAIEPVQTGLEEFEEQQYLSYAPSTVPDYELGLSPEELSDVLTRADAYYGDAGYDEMGTRDVGAPSSAPLSVAEQVAQYDPDVNLDLRDMGSELASGKISVADVFSPSLTDDDMGLPDISVDEAMFTRGDLGRSDVAGGTSIPLDPLGFATGDPMYPYNATLAGDDVVGDVGDVVTSASVPDVDIPSNKNVIDAVVAGVLTGTPVEGFDIQTSKIGMPREGLLGDLNNLFGSFGGQIILDSLIPGAGLVAGFASMVDPQKRQRIADMLSGYSGQAVYNSKGELIGAVDKMTGEYVGYPSNEGGFVRGDEGNLVRSNADVPKYADPFAGGDDDDVSVCPAGYEFDATIGQCVPIGSASAEEEPKISLKDVDRPDPGEIGIPVIPDEDPVEGMKIRTPKFFNRGGPVTPNIDRFLGSLRG